MAYKFLFQNLTDLQSWTSEDDVVWKLKQSEINLIKSYQKFIDKSLPPTFALFFVRFSKPTQNKCKYWPNSKIKYWKYNYFQSWAAEDGSGQEDRSDEGEGKRGNRKKDPEEPEISEGACLECNQRNVPCLWEGRA